MLYHVDVLTAISADRRRDAIELARRSELAAAARRAPAPASVRAADDVVIRLCRGSDDEALARLATLSGRTLPAGSFVVAESGGELIAALPLDGPGAVLADPFRPTLGLVDLLELRARQIRDAEGRRGSRWALLRRAVRV